MTANERKDINAWHICFLGIEDSTEVCANCKHFCKHYNEGGVMLYEGHCGYPRLKNRKLTDVCDYFEKRL